MAVTVRAVELVRASVAQRLTPGLGPTSEQSPRSTPRGYALRGIMRCGISGRKMQGSWNNGKPHYRCTFLSQVRREE